MSPTLWQRGIVSVMITLTAAIGLLASPVERTEPLRTRLRDAVAPGARLVADIRDWIGSAEAFARRSLVELSLSPVSSNDVQPAAITAERDAAIAEQQRMAAQLATLQAEVNNLRTAEERYLLRETATPLVQTTAVTARIIGNSPEQIAPVAERLIDAGAAHGLAAGDLVLQPAGTDSTASDLLIDQGRGVDLQPDWLVAARGSLLGRVRDCGEWTSTVQRITDAEFRIAARVVRMTPAGPVFGAGGVFSGSGQSTGQLELVPNTEPVAIGDQVYTQEQIAGQSLMLLIGTVTAADVPDGEPHWKISVAPEADDPGLQVDVLKLELNPRRLAASSTSNPDSPSGGRP